METNIGSTKKSKKVKHDQVEKNICIQHDVTKEEINEIQINLLNWYDEHQRVLPWREIAKSETNPNVRGYAIWVSEIMLQQTQVATVIPYFNNWIKKWPTVKDLASVSIEDVNKLWAGLGYYSRAKRLHEGSKIVMEKLAGNIPQTVDELMKLIPGIGLYSASAIASVAFQKPVGVVDGNVIRVLSRMKVIGAPVTHPGVKDHLWNIANRIVSLKRPGDFNQALMELGAVICTPQNPKCSNCPVSSCCNAYKMVKKCSKNNSLDTLFKKASKGKNLNSNDIPDIENVGKCQFCLSQSMWKENPQITAFPCKIEKKKSRIEEVGVVIIQKDNSYLLTKRPDTGLLAGLWEFPSVVFDNTSNQSKQNSSVVDVMLKNFGVPESEINKRMHVGEVEHIFSHIKTTYIVEHLKLSAQLKTSKNIVWSTEKEIDKAAISTAMKKVFAALKNKNLSNVSSKKRKRSSEHCKQTSIKSFFS